MFSKHQETSALPGDVVLPGRETSTSSHDQDQYRIERILITLIESMPGSVLLDPVGTIRAIAPAMRVLYGLGDTTAQNSETLVDAIATQTAMPSGIRTEVTNVMERAHACSAHVTLPPHGGSGHPFMLAAYPLAVPGLEPGWRIVQISPMLNDARDTSAISVLSDALSTSLANIKSASAALQSSTRRWDPSSQFEMVRIIAHESDILHQAIAGAQELQALAHRPVALRLASIELGDIVMGILADWKTRAPEHSFELALPGEMPTFPADAQRVSEALAVLIEFAVRMQPEGGSIRVTLRPSSDETLVNIRTHGVTLPADECERLFDPFHRPSPAPHALVKGGAGLAIARALILAHGGSVWASQPASGLGIELHLALPHMPPTLPAPPSTPYGAQRESLVRATTPLAGHRTQLTILIAERDPRMGRYLRANLVERKYRAVIASDQQEVFRLIDLEDPDLIVLDTQHADMPALDLLRHLLEYSRAAIILTAQRHDPTQCASALDLGAADYIAKPFSIDELLARVRRALRVPASTPQSEVPVIQVGGLTVDLDQRAVTVDGRPVALSKTEFKLLRALAQHPDMVLSHDVLLERVWGPAYSHEVEFVWVYIRRLRRKIEPDPRHPRYILTVPGIGYRLSTS